MTTNPTDELKERNNLIDALQAAVHPDQVEHTPVLLWGQLADFVQGYITASNNVSNPCSDDVQLNTGTDELKEKRAITRQRLDRVLTEFKAGRLEQGEAISVVLNKIEPLITASQNQSDDYNKRVADNCRMLANSTGPATWLDPVSGKKLYNEVYLNHLLDVVDDGVKDYHHDSDYGKGYTAANAAWHVHIAKVRGRL